MNYVALDIETSGLDPDRHQILEIAMVYNNSHHTQKDDLPTFHRIFRDQEIRGNAYALAMNAELIKTISSVNGDTTKPQYTSMHECVYDMMLWFQGLGFDKISLPKHDRQKVVFAGKNVGSFDLQFLKKLPDYERLTRYLHHRIIDPTMWYLREGDQYPPDLKTCCERAGIPSEALKGLHGALTDARMIVELMRRGYEMVVKIFYDNQLEYSYYPKRPITIEGDEIRIYVDSVPENSSRKPARAKQPVADKPSTEQPPAPTHTESPELPEFPREFIKHCSKVQEAREWRKNLGLPSNPEKDREYAECYFKEAGCGIKCLACDFFMSTLLGTETEKKFVPLIRAYNKQVKELEENQK